VGAATTVAAANALSIARRVIKVVLSVTIQSRVLCAQQLEHIFRYTPFAQRMP